VNIWFGVEFNFGLQAGHADDRYYYDGDGPLEKKFLDSSGIMQNVRFIGLRDEWRKLDIQLNLNKQSTIWRFPVETISLSEGGFEKVYQSSVVFTNWKINLNKKWQVKITQKLATLD
jgi:alpha-amylase